MTEPLHTVLIVTDDALLRLDIAHTLDQLGGVETVAAGSVSKAQAMLAARDIGLAVIDLDIGEQNVFALAGAVAPRAIPLLIISSYGPILELPAHLPLPALLEKPFAADVLRRMASELLAVASRNLC